MLAVSVLSLLATSCAVAQNLAGVWGSPLYRAELTVSGRSVSGTFTSVENPQAPAGTITGQLQADGRTFTAEWTCTVGQDTSVFQTWLSFAAKGAVLNGYRWTDEATPTSFSLHRAVNGQVPVLVDQGGSDSGNTATKPPGGNTGNTGDTGNTGKPGPYKVEVTICEGFADGQPQNIADEFTAPKSIAAFVRFTNLPANANMEWVWLLDGKPHTRFTKTVSGSGWQAHGLRSETAIVPGSYSLTIRINGQDVAQRTITVRAKGGTTPAGSTTGTGIGGGQAQIELIICERAPQGEPENQGTEFTKPKTVACLVKYRNLPANTQVQWVWKRGATEVARHEKTLGGNGWAWHGLSNPNGITPGFYEVTVSVSGRAVTTARVTVH
jgi:hypothetical protein